MKSEKNEKKELDPKWIKEVIDYAVGPYMIAIRMKSPNLAKELTGLMSAALNEKYRACGPYPLKDFVESSCALMATMVQKFIHARLTHMLEHGVPDSKPSIVPPPSNFWA